MVSQYANRNCTTVKQLAVNVLAGAAAITVGIAVGAVVGALGVALLPGSLLAAVAFGAAGGIMAGQYSRLVSNLILGRDPTEGMYNPSDMLIDGLLGGLGGAAGFLSAAVLKATGRGLALALGLTVSVDVGIGELAYAANQRLHGEEYEFSWQRVVLNAAISATTFGVGIGIGKGFQGKGTDEVLGGAYKDVPSNGGQNHHMPADSVSPFPKGDGPVINMSIEDHMDTASWGSSKRAQAYRKKQLELIEQGKFLEAQQMDIDDVHAKKGNKYDEHIEQMLEYTIELLQRNNK